MTVVSMLPPDKYVNDSSSPHPATSAPAAATPADGAHDPGTRSPGIEPLLQQAFACSTVGLAIVTIDGDVLLANDALAAHCAGNERQLIATCLAATDSWRPAPTGDTAVTLPPGAVVERRLDLADGDERWLRVHLTPISDAAHVPVRLVVHVEDVTDDLREARRLHDLALRDELTGLPNRRALTERLATRLGDTGGLGGCLLFYIDLDGFKVINDGLGHTAGDLLLAAIATRLRAQFAAGWVARYGGDEFVGCIAPADLPCSPRAFVRRIQQAIAAPVRLAEGEVTVTACVGRTTIRPDDHDPWQPITRADRAMYRAKATRTRDW